MSEGLKVGDKVFKLDQTVNLKACEYVIVSISGLKCSIRNTVSGMVVHNFPLKHLRNGAGK